MYKQTCICSPATSYVSSLQSDTASRGMPGQIPANIFLSAGETSLSCRAQFATANLKKKIKKRVLKKKTTNQPKTNEKPGHPCERVTDERLEFDSKTLSTSQHQELHNPQESLAEIPNYSQSPTLSTGFRQCHQDLSSCLYLALVPTTPGQKRVCTQSLPGHAAVLCQEDVPCWALSLGTSWFLRIFRLTFNFCPVKYFTSLTAEQRGKWVQAAGRFFRAGKHKWLWLWEKNSYIKAILNALMPLFSCTTCSITIIKQFSKMASAGMVCGQWYLEVKIGKKTFLGRNSLWI